MVTAVGPALCYQLWRPPVLRMYEPIEAFAHGDPPIGYPAPLAWAR